MKLNLALIEQFCEENPAFTPAAVRHLIANERQNGMFEARVVYRLQRRVYINVDCFFAWLEARQEPRAPKHTHTLPTLLNSTKAA
jgi:hypothetical protein